MAYNTIAQIDYLAVTKSKVQSELPWAVIKVLGVLSFFMDVTG
jgi:hypothetical protein